MFEPIVRIGLPAVSVVNDIMRAPSIMAHTATQILKSLGACLIEDNDCTLASIAILQRAQDLATNASRKQQAASLHLLAWKPRKINVENAPDCFEMQISKFTNSLFADEPDLPSPGALQVSQSEVNN